jgi:eukaryotic-like serine/threonine-protein kinase
MDAKRWRDVQDLLFVVASLDADGRADMLTRAAPRDSTLRREIETLLAHLDADPGFLETPLVAPFPQVRNSELPGERIGPYRLIRILGEGGMGTVYLAARENSTLRRYVALKMLRPGRDSSDFLDRFACERRILAALNHPHIAAMVDLGAAPDGRPYLVMEFVDGQPLLSFCKSHVPSIEGRLNLFIQICTAVHHAHRHLIVHCDLKPSNILVTEDGHVKLLDFGIARILDAESTLGTLGKERALTTQYASPEQMRGEAGAVASDVYSLGVILYELIAGTPPYHVEGRCRADAERIVCETTPAPPTARVRHRQMACAERQRLRSDLDYITLTALHKEPERRYASAEQLAEDIRRHLAGLPVSSRPESRTYLARAYVSRYRTAAVAATAVAILLVALRRTPDRL